MMINKAYKMMDKIDDIVSYDDQQQTLPNEEELRVKLAKTKLKNICFIKGKGKTKVKG